METTFRAWLHLLLSFLLCYYKKCPSSPQRSVLSLCVWILLLLFRTPSLPLKKVFFISFFLICILCLPSNSLPAFNVLMSILFSNSLFLKLLHNQILSLFNTLTTLHQPLPYLSLSHVGRSS